MKKIIPFEKKIDFPSMIGEITAISLDHNLKFIDSNNIEGNLIVSGNYKLTEASRIEEEFKYDIPTEITLSEKLDLSTAKVEIEDFYYEIENDDTLICNIEVRVEGVEEIEVEEIEEKEVEKIEEPTLEPIEITTIEEKKEKEIEETVEQIEETVEQIEPSREIIEDAKIEEEKIEERLQEQATRECDGDNTYLEETEENEMEEIQMPSENTSQEQSVGSLFTSLKDSEETFATYSVYILRQEETVNSLIEKYKTTKEDLENYNDLSNLTIGSKIIIPTTNES